MKFEEWWDKKLTAINEARVQPNPFWIKVYFENAYEYGRASARSASQSGVEADAERCVHPQGYIKSIRVCGLCGEQL